MRSEQEIMELILDFATKNKYIRVVGMEGSRTNINIPKDTFQDYDISFLVTNMEIFKRDDAWLDIFGKRLILQKPEDMELFGAELGGWFSYLMIFEDGNKIDLTLVPIEELGLYLGSDKLLTILLDKDNLVEICPIPTDEEFHVPHITARSFDDCQNEFWFVATYVAKGLCRKEYLFATEHFTHTLQRELFRMLAWKVGISTNFALSVGKSYKFLQKYITFEEWAKLQKTFQLGGIEEVWDALFVAFELFRKTAKDIAEIRGYPYPNYDLFITEYIEELNRKQNLPLN